ncbi:MAG TPA: HAMP domain-containing sensor histidine kinase [Microthrixaceae bacterium]|nr:HAMP domain-containing sensor histidine kinase [Microthrixaceae bacterium]
MTRLFGSVRVRLTAAVAVVFGVALSLAAFGLVRQVEAALMHDVQVRNDTVTRVLSGMLASGQMAVDAQDLATATDALNRSADREAFQEGITGSVIYVTGPAVGAMDQSSSLLDRLRQTLTGEPTPLFGKTVPDQVTPERFAISQVNIDTAAGPMVLNVASPLDGIRRTVDRVTNALLVAVPFLVLLVGAMTWFMTGRTLRPVSAITNRVQEITGSTLHERVPEPDTDDEIADLARTMNAMLDRLEGSSDRQKRFMSDASHELRSPVASIKTQLETALMHSSSTDWEEVARTVLAEDERLESLVGNLLALTRLEEGERRPPVEVDLDEVVYEQTLRTGRVPIDRSGVSAGRVLGVPAELVSVVRNLLDNARRHASSQVAVSVVTHGPTVRLAVEDDGPGILAADREKVFERFARLEEGRSRDAGGSGLGLALTRQVVEAHGGRVFVETSTLGGAAFVVELPAALDDGPDDIQDEVPVEPAPLKSEHMFDTVDRRGVQQP